MMGALSVSENLAFSASLRLPSHTTRQQRDQRVAKVIDELGLSSCANTKVRYAWQFSAERNIAGCAAPDAIVGAETEL